MSELKKFKIDVTPSWSFTVKGLLLVIETHLKKSLLNDESQAWLYIKEEFARCGDLADRFANEVRDGKVETPVTVVDKSVVLPEKSVAEIEETINKYRSNWEDIDDNGEDENLLYCKYRTEGFIDALEYVLGRKGNGYADTKVKG